MSRGVRQPRDQRRGGVRIRLTERDQALLRAVARFRIARSTDLGQLFFPGRNRDVVAQRLRKLYDAGYLNLAVQDRAAPNVYWLGDRGRAWLKDGGGTALQIPRGNWPHHVGVVRVWVRCAAAAHQGRFRLRRFVPEWEIREGALGRSLPIVPDALLEVVGATAESVVGPQLALEVDRGTEGRACLRKKLEAYDRARLELAADPAWADLRILLVLLDEGVKRRAQIEELAMSVSGKPALVTIEEECIDSITACLTPVTTSRCGNGSGRGESSGADMTCDVTGGGPSDEL